MNEIEKLRYISTMSIASLCAINQNSMSVRRWLKCIRMLSGFSDAFIESNLEQFDDELNKAEIEISQAGKRYAETQIPK